MWKTTSVNPSQNLEDMIRDRTNVYSMCVITYKDGTKHEMMVKTAPSIATHIVKTMKDTGYLSLWNDTDSFICDAELVRTIELRKVTK